MRAVFIFSSAPRSLTARTSTLLLSNASIGWSAARSSEKTSLRTKPLRTATTASTPFSDS